MARIEKNDSLEKQIGAVKGDVVREVRRGARVHHPLMTCSIMFVVAIGGVGLFGAWAFAGTGLARIPLFTSLAYHLPEPTRLVTPGVPVETVLEEQLTSILTQRMYEGGGVVQDQHIQASVGERSLTASLRTLLEESNVDQIDVSRVQVVIEPGRGVEVFAPLSSNELDSAVVAVFDVGASNGSMVVTPNTISIGSRTIPGFLVTAFLQPFLETELVRLNALMVGYAKIDSVEVLSGTLLITGELTIAQ